MGSRVTPLITLPQIPIGLEQEGIYRLSGMKSKIEELKTTYDKGMVLSHTIFVSTQVHCYM